MTSSSDAGRPDVQNAKRQADAAKRAAKKGIEEEAEPHATRKRYHRFDRIQRLEHAALLISFTVLSVTGLPQKYPDSWWGKGMLAAMGGIEMTRVIHHSAAVLLIAASIFHLLALGYRLWVQRAPATMMPGWRDVQDAIATLSYDFGKRKLPPLMGHYNFGEKIEYWAVIWGTVIMVLTGFVLWNPILVTKYLPGQFVPASKAAHGGEALLAVLSIITWHFYNVHLKHFNRSIFTGRISGELMEEEHGRELEEIEDNTRKQPNPSTRRRTIYVPIATVVGLLMLATVYFFLTYEDTAITTVPRQDVEIYVPAEATETP
ncbi:MAG: cytochrome b/b6 domain-containing protein [Caldilineaceae bacterium]|nr:cytochrome b/b6 domain-containing protein [Caldilineaceae bacterium]